MLISCRCQFLFAIYFCAIALACPAASKVRAGFYGHDYGDYFPHAFVVLRGTVEKTGQKVDRRYGFTAEKISIAILAGPVVGTFNVLEDSYITSTKKYFEIVLTDAQYLKVLGTVEEWKSVKGKSYSLQNRNCIHFVGKIAETVGLRVTYEKRLLRKPILFLQNIMKLNPGLSN